MRKSIPFQSTGLVCSVQEATPIFLVWKTTYDMSNRGVVDVRHPTVMLRRHVWTLSRVAVNARRLPLLYYSSTSSYGSGRSAERKARVSRNSSTRASLGDGHEAPLYTVNINSTPYACSGPPLYSNTNVDKNTAQ